MVKILKQKVLDFIQKEKLFTPHQRIICAVSGGVDSVCLLHLLHALNYSLVLAHVNHHKRKASKEEELAMKNLALSLNIPFEQLDYYDEHKDNFQAKAHEARYSFFKDLAKKYNTSVIATAHHLNDQAETILMRLLSGSNLYGYAGISIKKQEENITFVRPFLCVSKEEIYAYARIHNITFFEDESNASDTYFRNRIRHHVLPLLAEENENYLEKFQEFSVIAKQSFQFIRKQSINYLDKLNNIIEVSSFISLDIALQTDILCLLFERFHLEKNNAVISCCLKTILNKQNKSLSLKNDYFFCVVYGKAFIEKKRKTTFYNENLDLNQPVNILDQYVLYFSKKIPQNNAKYLKLCYNDLKLPLIVRNRKEGDFIKMSYGNKKVARIMIDEKVPLNARDLIPIITDQNNELLWVYGLAKSQLVASQKDTGDIYLVCEEIIYDK